MLWLRKKKSFCKRSHGKCVLYTWVKGLVEEQKKYYNEHIERAMQWCVPKHSSLLFLVIILGERVNVLRKALAE